MRDFARKGQSHRSRSFQLPHWLGQLGVLLVLGVLVIGGLVTALFALLGQRAHWNGQTQQVIALFIPQPDGVRTQVVLVNIDPSHQTLSAVTYPDTYEVQAGQAGSYSISALYGLSQLNHQSESELVRELMQGTGVLIDTVAVASRPLTHPFSPSDLPGLLMSSHGEQIGIADRLTMWWYIIHHVSGATVLPPGDGVAKAWMHPQIGTEGYSIAVVNSSGKTHIASLLGTLLTKTGMNVIGVTDTAATMDQGRIIVATRAQAASYTAQVLEELFGVKPVVDASIAAQYRAMIVIFIGKHQATTLVP